VAAIRAWRGDREGGRERTRKDERKCFSFQRGRVGGREGGSRRGVSVPASVHDTARVTGSGNPRLEGKTGRREGGRVSGNE